MTIHNNLDGFGDDSESPDELPVINLTPSVPVTAAEREKTVDAQGPAPLSKSIKRVWIQLEDSDEIPPTGQFIGANGRSYMIRPGEPVLVPEEVIEVLQDAVMSVPVMDNNNNVSGYRDRLRFPFRFVRAPQGVPA